MVSSSIARNAAVEEKSMTVGGTGTTRAFAARKTDKDMAPRAGGGSRTMTRSEGRRVGKECVSTCSDRWSALYYIQNEIMESTYAYQNNQTINTTITIISTHQ